MSGSSGNTERRPAETGSRNEKSHDLLGETVALLLPTLLLPSGEASAVSAAAVAATATTVVVAALVAGQLQTFQVGPGRK